MGYSFDETPNTELSIADPNATAPPASGSCGTDTYANYGKAQTAASCGPSCHPTQSTPDLTMQSSFVSSKAAIVLHVTSLKDMPLGGTMADADRTRFAAWVNCGAP